MTAKQYLSQLKRLDMMINQKLCELDDLRSRSTGIGSLDYSKDRVQTSPSPDAPYTKTIQTMVDLSNQINELTDEYIGMIDHIDGICHNILTDDEYEIIRLRYYFNRKWTDIMGETGHNDRTIFRIHGRALEKLEVQDVVV